MTLIIGGVKKNSYAGCKRVYSFKEAMKEIRSERCYDSIDIYPNIAFDSKVYEIDEEFNKFLSEDEHNKLELNVLTVILYEIVRTEYYPKICVFTDGSNTNANMMQKIGDKYFTTLLISRGPWK